MNRLRLILGFVTTLPETSNLRVYRQLAQFRLITCSGQDESEDREESTGRRHERSLPLI